MPGKRKKKGRPLGGVLAVSALVVIMAFSLAVRWWGRLRNVDRKEYRFRLEVLNGTGESGVAMETAMELRKRGIDVLIVGDADRYDFEESLLIDRRGNDKLMARLSRILGCRRIIQQIQKHPLVDATFIIGKDRHKLKLDNGSY